MLSFGHPGEMVKARVQARKRGEELLTYKVPLRVAAHDERLRLAMADESPARLASLVLAEEAGFDVTLDVSEWVDDEPNETGIWITAEVAMPRAREKNVAALLFVDPTHPNHRSIVHRSTRHGGWQVSHLDGDMPFGHSDIEPLEDAFDSHKGVFHGRLLQQVVLTDGRILTRAGVETTRINPTDAKASGKAGKLNDLLVALDRALTDRDPSPTSSARTLTEEDMVFSSSGVLYLSDGGWSRVVLGSENGRLSIDPGLSRPKPLERWSSTAALRRQIEDHLREWVRAQGADPVEDMGWEPNPRPRRLSVLRRKIRW